MIDIAYAAGGGGAQGLSAFIPIILLFLVFYFLLIRPQQKRAKEHREMVARLKKDDQVLTTGGLYGRVTGLTDTVVTLEIADRVRVKVSRNHIAAVVNPSPEKGD